MADWRSLALDALRGASQGAVTGVLGGPVDLATMAMRPLGYDVEKPVAGSEWWRDRLQQAGAYQPRTGTPAEAIGEFGGAMLAPGPDPMQYAALGLGGAAAIKAYHGSPHTFDRFDMSKIGSGEGAQAYGHGLYFAENPGVAEGYRDQLSRTAQGTWSVDGRPVGLGDLHGFVTAPEGVKSATQQMATSNIASDLKSGLSLDSAVAKNKSFARGDDEYTAALDAVKEQLGPRIGWQEPGATYTVNLDVNHDDLLDWDAPLSQQPEKVRKALESQGFDGGKYTVSVAGDDLNDQFVFNSRKEAEAEAAKFREMGGFRVDVFDEPSDMTGADVYRVMEDDARQSGVVSNTLNAVGIPGIRYLDAGSRAGGEGTSNIVMFDDALAQILERNGQPVASGIDLGKK